MYQFGISIIADGHTLSNEEDRASRSLKMPNTSVSCTIMGVIQSDLCVYSFSQNTKPKREWQKTIPNEMNTNSAFGRLKKLQPLFRLPLSRSFDVLFGEPTPTFPYVLLLPLIEFSPTPFQTPLKN